MQEISLLPEGVEADVESTEPMTVDSGEDCPLEDSKLVSDEPVENLVEQAVEPVASPSVEPVASPVSSVFVPTAISGVNDGILPEDLNKLKVRTIFRQLQSVIVLCGFVFRLLNCEPNSRLEGLKPKV